MHKVFKNKTQRCSTPLKDLSIQPQCYSTKYSTFYKTKIQPVWPLCILCDCAVSPATCIVERDQYLGNTRAGQQKKKKVVLGENVELWQTTTGLNLQHPASQFFLLLVPSTLFSRAPLEVFQHQSEAFSIIPLFRHFGLLFGHIYKCNMIKGKNQMSLILIWHYKLKENANSYDMIWYDMILIA